MSVYITEDTYQIMKELGRRIQKERLCQSITPQELSLIAGVSLKKLARLEQGQGANLTNFINVLRALNYIENLDLLVPEAPLRPTEQIDQKAPHERKRATTRQRSVNRRETWKWGDEE
ncbi:MAG: hypothetical protein IJ230_07795 [Clostridia bacterium]|nr:hypothetical protein [Clostridia bacterium]